jgi:hypothetical protein
LRKGLSDKLSSASGWSGAGAGWLTSGVCRWALGAGILVLVIAFPAWAQQSRVYHDGNSWVEEISGILPAARQLRIKTDFGSVQVQGNSPNVSYVIRKRSYADNERTARKQFHRMRISALRAGEGDLIEGKLSGKDLMHFNAEFVVQVPRGFELLKVDTRGGSLNFASIAAPVMATTRGGAVRLEDMTGPVKITSGGGNVDAGNLGSDFSLISGGGDVHVNNVGGQTQMKISGGKVYIGSSHGVSIQSGAGSIEVRKCFGSLAASTGGGNLNFGDVAGSVQATTLGGTVHLASAEGRVQVTTSGGNINLYRLSQGAQVETGAGSIVAEFVGGRGGFSDSSLHTASGDVVVYLPYNLPVTVHASSDLAPGRGIQSDFSGVRVTDPGGNMSPRAMYAEGNLNGGGPMLRVRTTIGQIVFRTEH